MTPTNAEANDETARRLRLAEVSSSLGAGILGLGIGVLLSRYLSGIGVPILVAGLPLHSWGMADKHRLEAREGAPPVWWSTLLYWICWLFLAGLAALSSDGTCDMPMTVSAKWSVSSGPLPGAGTSSSCTEARLG